MDDGSEVKRVPLRPVLMLVIALPCALGIAGLTAWLTGFDLLAAAGPGLIPMAPSTALIFLLYGAAGLLRSGLDGRGRSRIAATILVCAGLVAAMVLLVLSSLGIYLEAERIGLAPESMLNGAPLGHMSPITAFFFVLSGIAYLVSAHNLNPLRIRISFALACIVAAANSVFVLAYLIGAPLLYGGAFIPPALTTVAAFLCLGAALAYYKGWQAWPADDSGDYGQRTTRTLVAFFIVTVIGIVAAGFLYSRSYRAQYREKIEHELIAVAQLKAGELAQWRRERMGDASLFHGNENFSSLVKQHLDDPENPEIKRRLTVWLDKLRSAYSYIRVCLYDIRGVDLLSSPAGAEPPDPACLSQVRFTGGTGRIIFRDFYRDPHDNRIYLAVLVPVADPENPEQAIAVLAMRVDPDQHLYPLLNRWPTPSRTAETTMVRRDGDTALFLNNLRFKKNAALNMRVPLTDKDRLSVQAVTGSEGIVSGRDYHGMPVVAAIRHVPDSPWILISRINASEVFEQANQKLWILTVLMAALITGAAGGVGMALRHQALSHFRERLASMDELRESEERYHGALDSMMEGCQILGFDWRYLYINETAAAQGRRAREELLGHSILDMYPGIENTDMFASLKRCMGTRASEFLTSEFVYPDGGKAWFELSVQPVPEGLFILSMDVTERRRSQERIAHLNQVLRAIRDVNQLIVREKDPERLIHETCALLVEHRGYDSALVILTNEDGSPCAHAHCGMSNGIVSDLIGDFGAGRPPSCMSKARDARGICHIRDRAAECGDCAVARDSDPREAMCILIRHEQRIFGYLMVSVPQDVGIDEEEKALFEEVSGDIAFALHGIETGERMRQAREDRDRIESEFRQAQKMDAVGRLAGGIAHDFNNMLTVIINYAEFVLMQLRPDDPLRSDIEQILQAGQRSAELTKHLLAFSRKQVLTPEIISVNTVVRGIEKMIQRLFSENILLETYLAPDLWTTLLDPHQLEQVIMNLAINARDAMPEGGKLIIETANATLDQDYAARHPEFTPGEYAMLCVTDTGCGMDPGIMDRIFDPFFTTKALGQGTGLGLSTVHGIVKQSGGHIWVYSEPGKGTSFKIHLPRAETGAAATPAHKGSTASSGGSETVLVAEDESIVRGLMQRVLTDAGYTVIVAENAQDALLACERHAGAVSLLVTDVVMPDMKGPELAERLKNLCPGLKVLFISGYTENSIVHHGVLDDGIHFLPKPFSVTGLLEKVREVLNGPA